jgi:hypothetical protein
MGMLSSQITTYNQCDHTHTSDRDGFKVCLHCGECIGTQWEHDPNTVLIKDQIHLNGFKTVKSSYDLKTIRYTANVGMKRRDRQLVALTMKFGKRFDFPDQTLTEALRTILSISFKGQNLEIGICAVLYMYAKRDNLPIVIEDFQRYFDTTKFYMHLRFVSTYVSFSQGKWYNYRLLCRFAQGYLTETQKQKAYSLFLGDKIQNVQAIICAVFAVYASNYDVKGLKERFYKKHERYVSSLTIRKRYQKYRLEGVL